MLLDRLAAAVKTTGLPSSDYDLNADVELPPGRTLRPAAVLVPVTKHETVILTKRSSRLKHHPGQIAFPGGKVDDGDSGAVAAALREAHEEIGLPPGAVHVVGTLPPHETVTGFTITPVVGYVSEMRTYRAEVGEVEEIFEVPLAHVIDPATYVIEGRLWRGTRRLYYTTPYGPYYIWGATARVLRGFADRMNDAKG